MRVGILGGTGPQGRGLASRHAGAGHDVMIGSRSAERAERVAAEYPSAENSGRIIGASNSEAATAELVIVTVPYDGHAELLSSLSHQLAGKIVVDCVNPLGFDSRAPYPHRVTAGSAAQEDEQLLPGSTVISALHHVSAVILDDPTVERFNDD